MASSGRRESNAGVPQGLQRKRRERYRQDLKEIVFQEETAYVFVSEHDVHTARAMWCTNYIHDPKPHQLARETSSYIASAIACMVS